MEGRRKIRYQVSPVCETNPGPFKTKKKVNTPNDFDTEKRKKKFFIKFFFWGGGSLMVK
jgi:hypothetical protein